jgi:hypothetical protein
MLPIHIIACLGKYGTGRQLTLYDLSSQLSLCRLSTLETCSPSDLCTVEQLVHRKFPNVILLQVTSVDVQSAQHVLPASFCNASADCFQSSRTCIWAITCGGNTLSILVVRVAYSLLLCTLHIVKFYVSETVHDFSLCQCSSRNSISSFSM